MAIQTSANNQVTVLSASWNSATTAYTALKIDVNNILTPTGSLLLDIGTNTGTYSSKFLINVSGSVGIGTATPGAILHTLTTGNTTGIFATSAATGWLELRRSTSTTLGYIGTGGGLVTGAADADLAFRCESGNILFSSVATERARIDSSGNVGIGTSSFTGRLYVSGSSTGTTPSLLVRHGIQEGSDLPIAQFQNAAGSNRFAISGSGFVSMTGNEFRQTSATNDYIAKHTFYNSGASYLGFVGYQGDASLNITNEVGRVYIAPAANWPTIVNGGAGGWVQVSASDPKVGINTNDPLYTLHIEDISASEDCVVYLNGPRAKVFSTFYADFGSDGSSGAYSGVAGAAFIRTSADPLIIQTSYVERMRITAGGDVGIGTTSITAARLHVQGGASGTDTTLRVRHGVADGSSLPVLDVQNSAGTSLLFVSGSGGVGIGTNDTGLSTVRLYVSSSLTGNAASALLIGAQSFGTSVNTSKAFTHLFQLPDGTETARITSSGNVGIGTNAAITSRLQVSGSSSVTAPAMTVRAGTAIQTGGTKVFQVLKNDGTGIFHVSGSGDVYVDNGNLIMGTSGKGIDFSAASNAASGSLSSELLDDYEEGTWTPQCSGSSGGVVNLHPSSTGAYTKVGRLVHCQFYVSASSITGTMSGYLRLFGLPFQAASTGFGSFGNAQNVEIYLGSGFSTTYAHTNVTIQASTNFGQGWYYTTSAAIVGAAPRIVAGSVFDGMLTYITDQ